MLYTNHNDFFHFLDRPRFSQTPSPAHVFARLCPLSWQRTAIPAAICIDVFRQEEGK